MFEIAKLCLINNWTFVKNGFDKFKLLYYFMIILPFRVDRK